MRFVVTGGGTGGHIFPAIAVCEAIKRADPGGDILYIGGVSGMETNIVPAEGIPFYAVEARKMPARPSLATLRGLAALARGYVQATRKLREFGADVVIGSGGYVAAATVLAATRQNIPTVILENNLIPGRTNLKLAKTAGRICVSFSETIKSFPAERCVVTGLPLRQGVVAPDRVSQVEARAAFPGLKSDLLTLLVIGGSQGARAVNRLVTQCAPALINSNYQIIHQIGPKNGDDVELYLKEAGLTDIAGVANMGYVIRPFLDSSDIPLAYRAANIILCRGGISTISEAAINGLPMVIIPLPTSYADHQTKNALALESIGAARCLRETDLNAVELTGAIVNLFKDAALRHAMSRASLQFGKPGAADDVVRLAMELVN